MASNKRVISLPWPLSGLDRKNNFQAQPPHSTGKALNVWNANSFDRRDTGGSRAGTDKQFSQQLGSGAKVNLLSSVEWSNSAGGDQVYSDRFEGTWGLSSQWTAPTFLADDGILQKVEGQCYVRTPETQRGGIYSNVTINASSSYDIMAFVASRTKVSSQSVFRIYARMDSSTPNAVTSGVYVQIMFENVLVGSDYYSQYSYGLYANGSLVTSGTSSQTLNAGGTTHNTSGLLVVTISADTVSAKWKNTTLFGATSVAAHAGQTRVGVGMEVVDSTAACSQLGLYQFFIRSATTSIVDSRVEVLAASNGQLYRDVSGTLTAVGSASALNADNYLQCATHTQKVYIANYSITDAAVVPKVYDPAGGTVSTLTATSGTAPTRCKLVCRYMDSIVFGNQFSNPHLWFMSRKGDPLDWDYTDLANGDNGSAIAGNNSDAGAIGAPLTALAPFGDDYMIMACLDSLWVMRGDPRFGGQIDNITRKIGVLDKFSWCYTPDGSFLFLSKDGLYILPSGATTVPQSIGREKLPNELTNIDTGQYDICMEYDVEFRGAWIFVRSKFSDTPVSWFFDWENKAFWPVQYPTTQTPTQACFIATPSARGVLLGCADGYVRRHDRNFVDDDGTAFDSYVYLGPFRPAGSGYDEGVLTELIGTIHYENKGPVDFDILTGRNAQDIFNNGTVAASGTWTAGTSGDALNTKSRARVRGGALAIKLSNGGTAQPWGIEEVLATIKSAGKQRVPA